MGVLISNTTQKKKIAGRNYGSTRQSHLLRRQDAPRRQRRPQIKRTASAKANVMKVVYSPTPARVGYRYLESGGTEPIPRTITATLTPKSGAANITFKSTDEQRAYADEQKPGRHAVGNNVIVPILVRGRSATPTDRPGGDAFVIAKRGADRSGDSCPIIVVVPKSVTHTNRRLPTVTNGATARAWLADGSTTYSNLTTDVSQIVDLDISDQVRTAA